jgi:membrane-associated phospholipid phosphatase
VKSLLLILGLCLLISLLISLAVIDADNPITRFDHDAVNTLHEHTTPAGVHFFERVTWFGSPGTWYVSLASLVYLIGRTRWADFFTGSAMIGGGKLLNVLLKDLFDRPRPVWNGAFITESSPAFPSGHAMMPLLVYAFLVILLWRTIRNRPAQVALVMGMTTLVGLIGFSRVYLGVHYPTDVTSGYTMGGAWLSLCLLGKIGTESRRAQLALFTHV